MTKKNRSKAKWNDASKELWNVPGSREEWSPATAPITSWRLPNPVEVPKATEYRAALLKSETSHLMSSKNVPNFQTSLEKVTDEISTTLKEGVTLSNTKIQMETKISPQSSRAPHTECEDEEFSITANLREIYGGQSFSCDRIPTYMTQHPQRSEPKSEKQDSSSNLDESNILSEYASLDTSMSEYASAISNTSTLNAEISKFESGKAIEHNACMNANVQNKSQEFVIADDLDIPNGSDNFDTSGNDEYYDDCDDVYEESINYPSVLDNDEDEEQLRKVRLTAFVKSVESVPSKSVEGVYEHPLYYNLSNQKGFQKNRLERQGIVSQVTARSHHLRMTDDMFAFKK